MQQGGAGRLTSDQGVGGSAASNKPGGLAALEYKIIIATVLENCASHRGKIMGIPPWGLGGSLSTCIL